MTIDKEITMKYIAEKIDAGVLNLNTMPAHDVVGLLHDAAGEDAQILDEHLYFRMAGIFKGEVR